MNRKRKPRALSVLEAGALLGLGADAVRRLARRKEIPASKVGREWRFDKEALQGWSKARSRESATVPKRKSQDGDSCPVVGIGASAGGLEALEQFLQHVPSRTGVAFVIVQHLDPTRKGMMVELLQRATTMPVLQVKDRTRVAPDHVYVIPPNKDLSILHGVLHLLAPVAPRGLRLPIDFFFRSLAADQKRRSIGVILSGMGSDGSLGLRAIKEQAGVAFVQEPLSAKFDAMPRSAIEAGLADVVVPAEELGQRIVAYLRYAPLVNRTDHELAGKTHSALEKICVLLRSQTGHDFSQYKRSTIYRRIERRMGLHQIDGIANYVQFLRQSPQEADLLFKELLIGVTSFFRDPAAWEALGEAIAELISERPAGEPMRAWVPGCSTGEEAYSLAILFREVVAEAGPRRGGSLQVFATDLDRDAIERARQGVFPRNIAGDVSAGRLRKFFLEEKDGYRVGPEVRETVIFATQNIIMDPPFTKLDILSCRNLLIYLEPELQRKLLPLFHYTLNPRGLLFLGNAETVGAATELFAPLTDKTRIYRRLDSPHREQVEFPSSFHPRPRPLEPRVAMKKPVSDLQTSADRVLLDRYSPAAVLTNQSGDIVYVSGHTGKYLEPAAGKANWNVHAMAREGLRYDLGVAFQKALQTKRTVTRKGAKLESHGAVQTVDVTVEPLSEPGELCDMVMIVFADVAPPATAPLSKTTEALPGSKVERMLRQAREELRTTREEMHTSQEELKSANEELQSTNEELQSTNEELTTSKEEMQSMNEELQTLNHELQAKVDELSRVNDDMRNLLDSTDIATLFLDDELNVRRFTAQMTKLIKLIPADVGRPLSDLASDLIYPDLAADARAVLRTLAFKETPAKTVNGLWYLVRIMPYRTLDNRIDGVVITFVDITAAKLLEAKLRLETADRVGE